MSTNGLIQKLAPAIFINILVLCVSLNVHAQGGQLAMMLTKNDVWDARLDSALDPPLPTLELIERLASQPAPHGGRSTLLPDGWGNHGADSYHAHPYPCPRACGKLILSNRPAKPVWQRIRAEGTHNAWEFRDGVAVMSIEGRAEASNGCVGFQDTEPSPAAPLTRATTSWPAVFRNPARAEPTRPDAPVMAIRMTVSFVVLRSSVMGVE